MRERQSFEKARELWKNGRKTEEKAGRKGVKFRKGKALKKLGT